jgi:anti-anti-sigma factor
VRVSGEIDLSTVEEVRAGAMGGAGPAPDRLVLDLRDVTFMDTSGIRLLVELMRREAEGGPALVVVEAHPSVRRLLDIAGLTPQLRLVRDPQQALR